MDSLRKRFGLYMISVIIALLSACDSEEIIALRQENKELKETIELIKQELDNFEFSAIVVPKSNKVKPGQQFEAMVGLAISNRNSPIIVQLGTHEKVMNLQFDGDTLTDYYGEFGHYKNTTYDLGEFWYGGRIIFDFFDREIERLFIASYEVTN